MTTRKGTELAVILHRLGGGKAWETDETCSRIMRAGATYTRLLEEECSGPRWSWNYRGDWTQVVSVEKFTADNERKTEATQNRLVALVADLPPTEHGAIGLVLGGDPRGYTVRLLVPTAPNEQTEVCIDESGTTVGQRREMSA